MKSDIISVEEYLKNVPEERRDGFRKLRDIIENNIPEGFHQEMSYGMIGWVVPHTIYPDGYHANPSLPLPFISIGSQKNHISFYHLGIYAFEEVLEWFTEEYRKRSKAKLNMGKSCIRFRKTEHIPFELIEELVKKITVSEWIEMYEKKVKKSGKDS